MSYLFILGFISILGQVVLLRELSVASYGVELVYTLALGIWLLSTACGTMFQRTKHSPLSTFRISLLFAIFSICLPLDVAFIRSVRLLFGGLPGAYLPFHVQIASTCASLLPIGWILGTLFRWTAREFIAANGSLALAYVIESIGGIAGGLCATFLMKFGFPNFVLAMMCALAALGPSFTGTAGKNWKRLRFASLIVLACQMLLVWKAPLIDRAMTSWTHPNLVTSYDSPYSRITVTYLDGQVSVFENDALLFDSESTRAEVFVHLAALQHPGPERVLVLGGGVEGTIYEILMHSPSRVDYVELNPAMLRIVPPNLPPHIQKSLGTGKVRIIQADPRQFLNHALSYDLILVGMPEPSSGQANRFYTMEFFRQCRAKLNRGGILAFSLQSSENFWTPHLTRRMVGIYRAAKLAFPAVLFVPGSTNIVICAAQALTEDPRILANRLSARNIETRTVSAAYLRYLFTNDRLAEVTQTLESGIAPVNSDVHPICYQYTVMIWLSKFLPAVRTWDFAYFDFGGSRGIVWLLALSLPALCLSNARWPIRRAMLMAVAGFAGMALETVLLLHFQTKSGILYQDIGLLLTGFMGGLALGAYGVERLTRNPSKSVGYVLLGSFALLSAAVGWNIKSGSGSGLWTCLGSLALTGFLVSGLFAYASLRDGKDQIEAITPLYAADLIGGCLGSILATLVLAPMAGMAATVHLLIPFLMLSALLL
jgi:spermidine synthase